MEVSFAAATDVGRQRNHNEDNFLIDKKLRLFMVADGMGGHAAGEVASSIAVHEIRPAPINIYRRVPKALRQVLRLWRLSRGWKAQSLAAKSRQAAGRAAA